MKNSIIKIVLLLLVFGVTSVTTYKYTHRKSSNIQHVYRLDTLPIIWKTSLNSNIKKKPLVKSKRIKFSGDLKSFLTHMGKIEGLGSYATVSKRGYLGMYQFHPKTLKIMGVSVSKQEFLENPQLQDSVMIVWMKDNARSLRGLINKYHGTEYNGVYITKAGILAGAHLVGPGGVLSFFYPEKYAFRTTDGNGVHVSEYMKKFAHYDLRGL